MTHLVPISAAPALPALIAAAGDQAGIRFLEFFAASIRNRHTRRAYGRAVVDFLAGVPDVPDADRALIQSR